MVCYKGSFKKITLSIPIFFEENIVACKLFAEKDGL